MQTRYNLPIEIFYTIAPVMMVIVFFYFTVDTQNKVAARRRRTPTRPSRSSGSSGPGRSTTTKRLRRPTTATHDGDGQVVHEAGTTADRPTLWLVKDKSVTFYLDSPDVIHSFWVPGVPVQDGRRPRAATTTSR